MTTQVRTVRLYGKLGAKFGRSFRLAVETPAEAVQALASQLPGFEAYMYGAKDQGMGFAVFTGKKNIGEEELLNPSGQKDIRIAPIILGSKNNGVFQIILGAALIGVSFLIGGPAAGAFATKAAAALFSAGAAMVIGGVIQLLMPIPKTDSPKELKDDPSYAFAGPVNTTAQGHPVPVLYGRLVVGSAVISAGISLGDENVVPITTPRTGGNHWYDWAYDHFTRDPVP